MPSLFTSSSAGHGSGLSRLNSMARKWEDDPQPQPQSSGSREIEWSPSPERVKRKAPFAVSSASSSGSNSQAAREARRRAILEGLSMNAGSARVPSASSSSSTPSLSTSSSKSVSSTATSLSFASFASVPIVPLAPAPETALPDLRTLNAAKKRTKPWEEDITTARKVMETGGSFPRSNSASSTGSKKSKPAYPTINIKQKLVLSNEQQRILQLVVEEEKNVFFTGSAGTGKSVLLKEIIKALQKKHARSPDAVAVTASTGIAACNIGGTTLHSFGGVGLAIEEPMQLVTKIKRNKKAASRWTRTKVLIIDEISMVDGELFDKYNKVGQIMRKKPDAPFGGIQIICTGDFFQLPPVTKNGAQPRFCFEAMTWTGAIQVQANLRQVFRQKDSRFVEMLNEMRFGKLRHESVEAFRALARPIRYDDGIEPTELFPRREDVDRSNEQRLKALNTDGWSYTAVDGGAIQDRMQRDKMLSNFMAPAILQLKVGAQVMLIKNVDETLVNGSMGKVLGFCYKQEYVADAHGRWREHGVEEDIADREGDEEARNKLREHLRAKIKPGEKPSPVVRFNIPGGGHRDMLVETDSFKTELPNGEVQVSRAQLPLILAWAMSIHKAQGQTLDRVKVDLSKVFEKGQAYVALSRATSLEGLEVKGFRADKVMAHRKVAQWSEQLRDLSL